MAALCLISAAVNHSAHAGEKPIPVGVANFDYYDSSGEVRDQAAQHAALIRWFGTALSRDLDKTGRYANVDLNCTKSTCSAAASDPAALLANARAAGARMLIFGGVHKVSTMEQWATIKAVSTSDGHEVYSRLLTFRGDTDDAWQHLESFVATDFMTAGPHP
jgi:hypothetical protein